MDRSYSPPITVHFIWNPSDSELALPILSFVRNSFSRDKTKPFSRSLNLSLFQYSSSNGNEIPSAYPSERADNTIIFVFTSVNTVGTKKWKEYVEGIPSSASVHVVPVALDTYGLRHQGSLQGLNCIRAYEWPSTNKDLFAIVSLAHEIYRHGCVKTMPEDTGNRSSIKLFLSHSKSEGTGPSYSKRVKDFIDSTSMKRFFDATEIAPGFSFSEEIEKHISDSTLIAFESDSYSSRYWCQREILSAKEKNRPVLVVNCLDDYEDRIFPAASNVPCVNVPSSAELNEKDVLRILSAAIIETIRFVYSLKSLQKYKDAGWLDNDYQLFARPPEIRQILKLVENGSNKVCYPEPPIFSEEADWHSMIGVKSRTPLWEPSELNSLAEIKMGISISDRNETDFSHTHGHEDQLVRLAQEIARHSLARSATLIYGGDLRLDGFTKFILDEATILKERLRDSIIHIENHLAWPLYIEEQKITAWRAEYSQIMATHEHAIPNDVSTGISASVFLAPNSTSNSYIWSRSLTNMREMSINASTVRICAGGKTSGYKGKMSGVLEEIMIALAIKKPIFLLGGFDGIVGDVCKAILNKDTPDTLTENWQLLNNTGYKELQELAATDNHNCNYDELISVLHDVNLPDLASNVGLSEQEYIELMGTPFVDECVHTILKGLRKLDLNSNT
tara:strand:+ start:14394 stop:16418 length:2025 start_codon:yes stop_codon:yes gene_type:complete